jgi:hypothetical protein
LAFGPAKEVLEEMDALILRIAEKFAGSAKGLT